MPTRTLHRFWCTECKDYTLHNTLGSKGCTICGTITETYNLKDVPEEKVLEQRERYKKSKRNIFESYLSFIQPKNQLEQLVEMFHEECKTEIIETDAGQKYIDEQREIERRKKASEAYQVRKELEDEYKKYKKLGRNDICLCGSGRKYKNCCITKFARL